MPIPAFQVDQPLGDINEWLRVLGPFQKGEGLPVCLYSVFNNLDVQSWWMHPWLGRVNHRRVGLEGIWRRWLA